LILRLQIHLGSARRPETGGFYFSGWVGVIRLSRFCGGLARMPIVVF